MKPNQKLTDRLGREVALFPLEYLYMTQDEGSDFSHAGTLAMDFQGWGANGRIYKCPYYAPVTIKCIASTESANRIWQSLSEVVCPGFTDFITIVVAHDDTPPVIGTVLTQGELMGHTGTAGNVTGDHVHINIARGKYAGWEKVPPNGNWQLKNSVHVYSALYVNDTVIVEGYNHPWITYDGITPTSKKLKKFPWVLYANKIRSRTFLNV